MLVHCYPLQVNPNAKVSVKLVAEAGIGTVASGVAKGNADVIQVLSFCLKLLLPLNEHVQVYAIRSYILSMKCCLHLYLDVSLVLASDFPFSIISL